MNIWTWNINSIRHKMSRVNNLLTQYHIDILVVTETKIKPSHESDLTPLIHPDYAVVWNSNKISYYHGVALIYKKDLKPVIVADYLPRIVDTADKNLCRKKNKSKILSGLQDKNKLDQDCKQAHRLEGRIITAYFPPSPRNKEGFVVVGTYVPNSGVNRKDPLRRLAYRTLVWDKDLYLYLVHLHGQCKNVIWTGDLNVARMDCDMNRPSYNYAGTTQEERYNLSGFLEQHQWIDTWNHCNSAVQDYKKRWTYGMDSTMKLRIDYVICSPDMKDRVKMSVIDQKCGGSDHVPMGTIFNLM